VKKLDRRGILALGSATAVVTVIGRHARAEDAAPKGASPSAPPGDPPPLEIFAASPLIDDITLSPDGKRVAFISQKGDQKILGFFNIADKQIHNVGLGAKKVHSVFWGDNNHVVLVDSQTSALPEFAGWKNEFYLAQIINLDDMKIHQIFGNMEHFYNIVSGDLGRIKVNGEYRITASGYRIDAEGDRYLYSFGVSGSTVPHQIDQQSVHTEGWVITPAGVPMAYSEFNDDASTHDKEWTLYFNTAGANPPRYKKIYSVKGGNYPSVEGLGRDGKSLVISVKNPDDEGYDYHEISADGVLSAPLDTKPGDRAPLFHPVTGCLAGFRTHDDWFTYDYFDPLMKKLAEAVPKVLPEGYRFSIYETAEDPRKMIVFGESANDAGSYFFIDFSNGDVSPLANNYPDLPDPWITQKQAVDYKAGDGLNIHAYLTLPPGRAPKNLPLIVLPHGGPAARDNLSFDPEAQAFASRGYAVLQPNFRGSTGYGAKFENAGDGEWGRKMQTDLSDGIKHLAQQGIVDPKRVAIYGASYGGYAALAGATLDPAGTYRCAVDIAGVADLRSFLDFLQERSATTYQSVTVISEKKLLGDPTHYDERSPVRQAAKAYCPILIIHGTDDTVVPIEQSQRMERALKAAGKDVQFITYKGQTHWEDIGSSRVAMIKAAMDFIQMHNPA
jgi:dipeptidyl aminopeptidase/acylaminoacyl peptidase